MKWKVALLVVVSMVFGAIASYASLHGTFEGNPIVKVVTNGQALTVEDVPAINYNGRTMVPIYMLRQLGMNVGWDGVNETVTINLPENEKEIVTIPELVALDPQQDVVKANDFVQQYNGSGYKLIYDSQGPYVSVNYNAVSDNSANYWNLLLIAGSLMLVDATEIYIEVFKYDEHIGNIIISKDDAQQWLEKKISNDGFIITWKINLEETITNSGTPEQGQQSDFMCKFINDKYDSMIEAGLDVYGNSDFKNSEAVQKRIQILNDERNTELKKYGCPIS